MGKYKIWDRKEDIYTPGKDAKTGKSHFTASEWAERHSWIQNPNAKMIIYDGVINGACALEFESTKKFYKDNGADITDDMTDEEVLLAIEDYEQNPPGANEPSVEERTAAALEFLALNSLPDEV